MNEETRPARGVLTFGETMLRLTPPGRQRLGQAAAFDVWVAGSESNVAAALCALGVSTTWVSRLPDTPMGHKIADTLRAAGIDVSHVAWVKDERQGLFYAEPAAGPRPATVIYDRADSAASRLLPSDLPDALLAAHRHLHVSGITLALSLYCAEAVADAVRRAKARKLTLSLDVNYRARLWSPETAAAALEPLMRQADMLFCSRYDAARLFGLRGDGVACAQGLRDRFKIPRVAVTLGSDGAAGCDTAECLTVPAVPVETTVERFGSGDAFAAGFLAETLAGKPLQAALRLGVAAGALKRTIPGDMLLATRAEVEAIMFQENENGAVWR